MSVVSALESVETAVLNEFQNMEHTAVADLKIFWNKFEPVAESAVKAAADKFGPIVAQLVLGLAMSGLGGPAKFAAASAGLMAEALSQGTPIARSLADTLVQSAVATASNVISGKVAQ